MIFGYITTSNSSMLQALQRALNTYVQSKGIEFDDIIIDVLGKRVHWQQRALFSLLENSLQANDILIVYEASHLAKSTAEILEILQRIVDRGIILHLVKYNQIYPNGQSVDTEAFIELIQNIESDFIAKRVTAALAKRKAAGLPVGRPKGRKYKALKLDQHRQEIQKYLNLQISRASIAKLIDCNAQTLYNYIQKRNLKPDDIKEN